MNQAGFICYRPKYKRNPAYVYIVLPCRCPFTLSITKESIFTALGKGLGLSKEIQIRDSELDQAFHFHTKEELLTRSILSYEKLLAFLRELKGNKFFQSLMFTAAEATAAQVKDELNFIKPNPGLQCRFYGTPKQHSNNRDQVRDQLAVLSSLRDRIIRM